MEEVPETTCKTCGRVVWKTDVDAVGNCVFCPGTAAAKPRSTRSMEKSNEDPVRPPRD